MPPLGEQCSGYGCSLTLFLATLIFVMNHSSSAFTIRHTSMSKDDGRTCQLLGHKAMGMIDPPRAPTLDSISVTLPHDWEENNPYSWSKKAAATFNEYGVVALISQTGEGDGLIKSHICDNANRSAFSRVKEMHTRIKSRGMDPSGVEEPYRFAEILCRDDGGRRFDVPLPWLGAEKNSGHVPLGAVGSKRTGAPLRSSEGETIAPLHESIVKSVGPIMDAIWSKNNNDDPTIKQFYVAAAGFLMNQPGSASQNWHRDGPDEGFIDCFVPLIDLDESLGPTAIQPGTHKTATLGKDGDQHDPEVLIPLLNKGDILLFDYRTLHRGLANKSKSTTRTLAYAVFRQKGDISPDNSGDIHNFPAALTLEYD